MSKLSTFVRKYGEEIGLVGSFLLQFGTRLIPNRQDREQAEEAAQRLVQASKNIANSWHELNDAIPSKEDLFEQFKPAIMDMVAELVAARLTEMASDRSQGMLNTNGFYQTMLGQSEYVPPNDGIPDPSDSPAKND